MRLDSFVNYYPQLNLILSIDESFNFLLYSQAAPSSDLFTSYVTSCTFDHAGLTKTGLQYTERQLDN